MKSLLIVGAGQFGCHIAKIMCTLNCEIMAVDINESSVNEILPYVTNAQIGDGTNAEFLRSLGVGNYDVCIVSIGDNFQSSLETTALLKECGARQVWRAPQTTCRRSFYSETARTRWFTPKSSPQSA